MSRTACKFISLLVSCALLFGSLAGCSGENRAKEKYRLLMEKGIVIDNGITVSNLSDNTAANVTADYIRIDGLKDQAAEDKINRRIRAVVEEMRDSDFIPPYRGISLRLNQIKKQCADPVVKRSIIAYTEYNSNNLLTVNASCYVYYYDEDDSYLLSYSYAVPMNFDLTTGSELTLKDCFAPGTDYIELVNRGVDQCLMTTGFDGTQEEFGQYSHITTVSPFKTVRPEQKFLISSSGELSLYIDYDTPEFYTDNFYLALTLPWESLGTSFMPYRVSKKPLWESDETKCRFTARYNDRSSDQSAADSTFYGSCRYSQYTPETLVKKAESLTFDSRRMPITEQEVKKRAAGKLGTKKKIRISRTVFTNACPIRSSGYYAFTRQLNLTAMPADAWTPDNPDPKVYDINYNTSYCFDREGNPIEYYSMFNDPERADALLEQAIPKSIRRIAKENHAALNMTDEQAVELVRQLIPHIDGAAPQLTFLTISYRLSDEELNAIIMKTLDEPEPNYSVYDGLRNVDYSELGCGNLVFFNQAFH